MPYTRQDLSEVIGAAYEWIIAMDSTAETEPAKRALATKIKAFNKVIETLRFTIDELPQEIPKEPQCQQSTTTATGQPSHSIVGK